MSVAILLVLAGIALLLICFSGMTIAKQSGEGEFVAASSFSMIVCSLFIVYVFHSHLDILTEMVNGINSLFP